MSRKERAARESLPKAFNKKRCRRPAVVKSIVRRPAAMADAPQLEWAVLKVRGGEVQAAVSEKKPWEWVAFGDASVALAQQMDCWAEAAEGAQEANNPEEVDVIDLLAEQLLGRDYAGLTPESRLPDQTWICRLLPDVRLPCKRQVKIAVRQVPDAFALACSLSGCGGGRSLAKFCTLAGNPVLQVECSSDPVFSELVVSAAMAAATQGRLRSRNQTVGAVLSPAAEFMGLQPVPDFLWELLEQQERLR